MGVGAVQMWAGTKGWHAAVSNRKHVHIQHQIQAGMCSCVQAPEVVCLSSPALLSQQLQPVQCSCQATTRR